MINDNKDLREILKGAKTIAMIGCSPNVYRTSNYAAQYLQKRGYRVIPVNPEADNIYNEKSFDNLNDISENISIDIVNVFRNSKYSADAVRDVQAWQEKTGQKPVIWTQLDVSSEEAEEIAEEHELPYVKNRCIMVEYDRLMGEE
ncbi:CoA-binding protein [Gracilimonas mengyeensis]|uniref:CoA-binding domain-containing protein n=1 Tax=Gracilimonas mengyeensis TaxID=1302730 RepID=A0A521AUZ8_9BACT|nr:CoA-binding protein [Gracilimonas mengyeensis]SMO38637.1 hypothetical protein SAMN06265219_101389 [Gracilimonas mengyeensis]